MVDHAEGLGGVGEGDTDEIADGRSARRERNRTAVLDAVIDLFTEDNLAPGPEEVALRVGLSTRSVYRYFEDRDALVRAAIDRQRQIMLPLFRIHEIGKGSFQVRLERFLKSRLDVYEFGAAITRASRVRASFDAVVREQQEINRRALLEQVLIQFAEEIDALGEQGPSAAGAVDTLVQFEALDHLRLHQGLGRQEVTEMLTRSIGRLLSS